MNNPNFYGFNANAPAAVPMMYSSRDGVAMPRQVYSYRAESAADAFAAAYPENAFAAASARANAALAAAYAGTSWTNTGPAAFSLSNDSYDESAMPWERDGWVPRSQSGKQKTPNMIRGELQRYIDECKANGTSTQTSIIDRMGVNSGSFRRFMDPKTYKDQWSATQNGTYWAAAKLLEAVKFEKKTAKSSGAKRKVASTESGAAKKAKTEAAVPKKSRAELQLEATQLVNNIVAVEGVPSEVVYDTCPEIVAKIKAFLQRDGMTKALLLIALGNINSNSLTKFLAGKKQDQCGNITYKSAYEFFEKLRLLEGKPKSKARSKHEIEQPGGFSLVKERAGKYCKFLPRGLYE